MVIACPLAATNRRIPFHVAVPDECMLTGYVTVEQVKSLDHFARKVKFIETAPNALLDETPAILDAVIS